MAEYRSGHSLAASQELLSNLQLTGAQSPGAIPEVLSGEFDEPLDQSTWHQLWSSAMLLEPMIRGLFGIESDAIHGILSIKPSLPAAWDHVTVHDAPFGNTKVEVVI